MMPMVFMFTFATLCVDRHGWKNILHSIWVVHLILAKTSFNRKMFAKLCVSYWRYFILRVLYTKENWSNIIITLNDLLLSKRYNNITLITWQSKGEAIKADEPLVIASGRQRFAGVVLEIKVASIGGTIFLHDMSVIGEGEGDRVQVSCFDFDHSSR